MQEFFVFFTDMWANIINVLSSYRFMIFDMSVSIFEMFVALICISMVITIFWKGARG